jgi:hypothetical protein
MLKSDFGEKINKGGGVKKIKITINDRSSE